jgi:hypothetical protein
MALFRARWIISEKSNQYFCSTQTFFGEKGFFPGGETRRPQESNFDFVSRTNSDRSD